MWLLKGFVACLRPFLKFPPDRSTIVAWDCLIYILWAFWLILPFYSYTDDSIVASLKSGTSVPRAYSIDSFKPQGWNGWETHMLLTFQMHEEDGVRSLTFGGGSDVLHRIAPQNPTFNITNAYLSLSDPEDLTARESLSPPLSLTIPTSTFLTKSFLFNPSWFDHTDAALFEWWFKHSSREVSFKVRTIPREKILEIWVDNNQVPQSQSRVKSPGGQPILSIRLNKSSPEFFFPPSSISSSPTIFYRTRLALLLGLCLSAVFGAISFVLWLSCDLLGRRKKAHMDQSFLRTIVILVLALPLKIVTYILGLLLVWVVLLVRVASTIAHVLLYGISLIVGDAEGYPSFLAQLAAIWQPKQNSREVPPAQRNVRSVTAHDLEAGDADKAEEMVPLMDADSSDKLAEQ